MTITITNHAYERYAERIMNKSDKVEILRYVQENKEKITEDINKMIEYGKIIYSGKLTDGKGKVNDVNVYVQNTWIVIVGRTDNNCITLYKVQLGLGDDFDKKYIEGMLSKLEEAKNEKVDKLLALEEERETYKNLISDNEAQIKEYKTYIKNLENINEDYTKLCSDLDANIQMYDNKEKEIIEVLIGRRR